MNPLKIIYNADDLEYQVFYQDERISQFRTTSFGGNQIEIALEMIKIIETNRYEEAKS